MAVTPEIAKAQMHASERFPRNDREWADCMPINCSNGKCRATGECQDGGALPVVASPSIVPNMKAPLPAWMDDTPETRARLDRLVKVADPRPSHCPARMRAEGKAYPRSCRTCGIYKCQFGDDTTVARPRQLIALTGLAGSGKTTAALHLVNAHGFARLRFAGPLKAMMAALGLTPAEIDGDRKEQPCALLGGRTPRHAMQTLGTEWGRDLIASDLWIRAFRHALDAVPAGQSVAVDDCRFPNEAAAIVAAGGVLVRVNRPGAGAGAAGHSSEGQALGEYITLDNSGSPDELRDRVDSHVRDLSWAAAGTR